MKKLIIVLAALCMTVGAYAQIGVMAGVTSTETNIKDAAAKIGDVTQYHVGVAFKINLGILAIQPSLLYNVKGASITENLSGKPLGAEVPAGSAEQTTENKTGFLELPVQIQVGIPFPGVRPYAFAEPFIGYAITNESTKAFTDATGQITLSNVKKDDWDNIKNRLQYGVGLGAGIDLFDTFQISVRYFWNLGELYKDGQSTLTGESASGAIDTVREQKCNGIMASVAFFF
jgi:hypothetical protein